nr:putative receptor protein kinase ZmPK1 [Ipomoea batatas]
MSLQILIILLASLLSSSSQTSTLNNGASLSAPQDFLTSTPNGNFTAGFYNVGENAYCFAIWFSEPLIDGNHTVVWMANRDRPVNGVKSKLSLLKSGNLVLNDAGQTDVWSTQTTSYSPVHLKLLDNGNLVLQDPTIPIPLWQSFDSPTDVLLPQQPITGASNLVSGRSLTNHSSGFYKLFFDADNVLRLLYDGFGLTSVFWPSPWLVSWEAGRSTYNSSKTAVLNPFGHFSSSDDFKFNTIDHGESIPRILKLDSDGNLRVYSLKNKIWKVTWQAISQTCKIHGICGVNSLCNYIGHSGTRKCSCLPGHRAKNKTDWAYGCEPEFNLSCDGNSNSTNFGFVELNHVEFYGYDFSYIPNIPLDMCREKCRTDCRCRGFEYNFGDNGINNCFHKALLFNGYRSPDFKNPTYLKVPQKAQQKAAFLNDVTSDLQCEGIQDNVVVLGRNYREKEQKTWVKSFLWFTCAVGVFEILCLITFWVKTRKSPEEAMIGYRKIADRFQKFSYAEMKKATGSFSEEIGRGSSGVVYKGKLPDNRIAAIKRLHEANYQGEEEFLAEMSTIGKLNHMNLIEIWGYCAEGKHRVLVYEYMENGSLAKNLDENKLDWETRYEIAVGTAKGLAYLHEECLEWVLHCDVKPQNILLDSDFNPKVIDFGLSKLLERDINGPHFSRIRGTRGYMAPEWIYNLPITCKVDVYSYGIVLLEMITGKSPFGFCGDEENNMVEQRRLVSWVREKRNGGFENGEWVEEIVDAGLDGKYDLKRMEVLVDVALKCSEEDRDARPTMSQVVHMLLSENED